MFLLGRREDMSEIAVFLCVVAWSKGENVVNSIVFACFCKVEGKTCRK